MAVEDGAQRQQVVAETLERGVAAAAQLEAADRPGKGAVGVGARLQRGGELGELDRLLLAQLVGAGTGRGRPGGDPRPAILAGRGEGVGAEADAAGLEEVHDADQLAELGKGVRGALGALALLGEGEELRLPGGAAHALAAHRLDRRLDRVGADDLDSVGKLQARHRHPQPDQGRDQHVGLLGAAGLGLEHGERVA